MPWSKLLRHECWCTLR